jgi:NAD(P)H dehydrogenase (quinone)
VRISDSAMRRIFSGLVMTTISIVYNSNNGHTAALADAIARGAGTVDGVAVKVIEIAQRDIRDGRWSNPDIEASLKASDAIVLGSPTYMGMVSATMKTFLEWAFNPWRAQAWKDKVAAGFTNSASQSGDKLNTLIDFVVFAAQMGMIWVGVGDPPGNNWSGGSRNDVNRLGTWLGAMSQSNSDRPAKEEPPASDRMTGERLGRRVALITRRLKDGTPYEVERVPGR